MKCNVKRALEEKKRDIESVVKDFGKFVYNETMNEYYDKKNDTLNSDFFDVFDNLVTDINRTRLENGDEQFITFERWLDNKYGIWHDDAVSLNNDEDIEFWMPEQFVFFYSQLMATVCKPILKAKEGL